MKYVVFIFCLSALVNDVFGQNNSTIDLVGGVESSYRTMRYDEKYISQLEYIGDRSDEEAIVGYRIGLNFNQRIKNRFWFKTGIRYSKHGYKNEVNDLIFSLPEPGGLGDEASLTTVVNYYYLEIPLTLRSEFLDGKVKVFVETGMSPSLYLKNNYLSQYNYKDGGIIEENYSNDESDFNRINLVGIFSVGGSCEVSDKIVIFAQPTLRYHFTKLIKDSVFIEHLYNCGLEMGLRLKI